jgi:NAD-dependent histone deacetylase SIR2
MASRQEVLADSSLTGPVTEIIDLTSEESIKNSIDMTALGQERDPVQEISGVSDESDDEWENESLYEDALDGEGDEGNQNHGIYHSVTLFTIHYVPRANRCQVIDACTLEEALAFRKRLRLVGEDQFILETIEAEKITAKKLCTAFGIRLPPFLEGQPDVCRDE